MKKNIIKLLLAVAMLPAFVACDDWTETESLDIHRPTLEEQNPELHAQYMQALRDYKARDHNRFHTDRWLHDQDRMVHRPAVSSP
jgi:hypothetical protein